MANVSEFLFEHETVGEAAAGNNNNDNHAQPLPECCSGAETDADNADDRIYDEDDEKFLSEDTYSFMPASPTWSASFGLSLGVVTLRLVAYALIGANILNPSDHHNPLQLPGNVDVAVRVTQIIAIIVAVITQHDVITSLDLLRDGDNSELQKAFPHSTLWKYVLATLSRFIQGSTRLILSFFLIVSTDTVVDLLLNFTALEFISTFDEAFFILSKQ